MNKLSKKSKFWFWITASFVTLSLISGGFLLYHWWKIHSLNQLRQTNQELRQEINNLKIQQQEKENEAIQQYQSQQKTKFRLLALANNPQIHQFISDLLQGYAYRFAKKKNLAEYCLPVRFGEFYQEQTPENQCFRELGNASFNNQQIVISLNQIFLFSKLGHDRYFATPQHYLEISFLALIETISHELAHYIQFVKYGESSCESSGTKDETGKFLTPSLVKEHNEFTREIKAMIVNSSEYKKLKEWWEKI